MMTLCDRAFRYLQSMPPSIQGQAGSVNLFKACCALRRGFDLDFDTAWPLLRHWNGTHCQPPWSERDLRHKLSDAAKANVPRGYLLKQTERRRTPIVRPPPPPIRRLRPRWPACRDLTPAEVQTLATLRQLPAAMVNEFAQHGFLAAATVQSWRCFVIREAEFVQARRLDGGRFPVARGEPLKAKNLPGSSGAFLGQSWLGNPDRPVLLVEGAIGLLEAFVAQQWVDPHPQWDLLAATSASSRFARDPALLRRLAGRQVRLLPDADDAGRKAAASWLTDLERVGCQVEVVSLPPGFKDLGPVVAKPDEHIAILTALFA